MKLTKTVSLTLAALAAFSSATFAQENTDEYIKTFGQMMFERNGISDLKFTPAELDVFLAGIKDAHAGKKMPANIQEFGPKMLKYLSERAEANIAKEAEKSEGVAAEYWKTLEKKEGLNKTPTGLAYEIVEKGSGATPTENSEVVVKYKGTLIDGTVFDSTDNHGGQPATFALSNTIPGFREGLQKIAKGGKARLYIPAKLAYGNRPIPGIPPNSTLIFDVEMVDVDPNGAPQQPGMDLPVEAAPAPQPAQ